MTTRLRIVGAFHVSLGTIVPWMWMEEPWLREEECSEPGLAVRATYLDKLGCSDSLAARECCNEQFGEAVSPSLYRWASLR